jgi:hypothetical protein
MEYTILHTYKAGDLAKIVNEHLQDGWQLSGNLCIGFIARESGSYLNSFAQAMTRAGEFTFSGAAEQE